MGGNSNIEQWPQYTIIYTSNCFTVHGLVFFTEWAVIKRQLKGNGNENTLKQFFDPNGFILSKRVITSYYFHQHIYVSLNDGPVN